MRITTRSVARSTLVAIMTAFAALILGVTQTLTTAVTASLGLTAVQALIVPGTGTPNPQRTTWTTHVDYYLIPGGNCGAWPCTECRGPVLFATFWPIPLPGWGGLEGEKWNVSVADGVTSSTANTSVARFLRPGTTS